MDEMMKMPELAILFDPKRGADTLEYHLERDRAIREGRDDAAVRGQLNFQTPATEIMEKIVDLHNDLFFFIVVIVLFVS